MKKRFISGLLALCMILMLLPVTAWATDEISGTIYPNLSWSFDPNFGRLTISGTGSMGGWNSAQSTPWEAYKNDIISVVIETGVTSIGQQAFMGCTNLNSVTIADSVTTIGGYAFYGCSSLQTVDIPSGVTSMEVTTFGNCASLKSILVPTNNVNYATCGDGALYSKDLTVLLLVPGRLTGTFTVPNGVREIGANAFSGHKNLSAVILPDSITKINYSAFQSSEISSINIPSNVTEIGESAFMYCNNLIKVSIPASVNNIGKWAFYASSNRPVKEIYFFGNAPTFGSNCFNNAGFTAYYPAGNLSWTDDVMLNYGGEITWTPWNPDTGDVETIYSVSYNSVDGSGETPSTQNYKAGETVTISSITPVRDGYTFAGWSDGTTTYQASQAFVMPESDVTLTAVWSEYDDPSQWPINQSNVFLKQLVPGDGGTCTLASATMMLRRRAILDGISNWEAITETDVKKVAWGNGLSHNFTYSKMRVETQGIISAGYTTTAKKKAYFISMLEEHPEGIVIYNHSMPHAVLLTDYDKTTDTFYCADPSSNAANGRIPLANCTIPDGKTQGKTQDDVIGSIRQIWYITSALKQKTFVKTVVKTDCPVEMRISIGSETMDSTGATGTITNFSNDILMTTTGSGLDRSVEATIPASYIVGGSVEFELIGTGIGTMTITVEQYYTDGTTEVQTFRNVPVSQTTEGSIQGIHPQSSAILVLTDTVDTDKVEYWIAAPGETAVTPSQNFDKVDDTSTAPGNSPSDTTRPYYPSDDNSSSSTTYSVTTPVVSGGTVIVSPESASMGKFVTVTATPDPGYELMFLTVTDSDGKNVELSSTGNNKYTFTMPNGKVTVNAAFSKIWSNPFTDVAEGTWYYDAVKFVNQTGLMNGVGNGLFIPNANLSRAMLAEILYNKEGRPAVTGGSIFTDVQPGAWYADAVAWASGKGIVNGYGNDLFGPGDDITREQFAVILYRYAGSPVPPNLLLDFTDAYKVSDWAQDAIRWAVDQGILNGKGNGILDPIGKATRAEAAQILKNYLEK